MSTRDAWDGEPRVIYHDILDRIESLKNSRADDESTNNGSGSGKFRSGNNNKRFVSVMLDRPGPYSETRNHRPELSVIDAEGKENRKWYHSSRALGPLDVGSVIVLRDGDLRDKKFGTPVAAYFVGEEENQVCTYVCVSSH